MIAIIALTALWGFMASLVSAALGLSLGLLALACLTALVAACVALLAWAYTA